MAESQNPGRVVENEESDGFSTGIDIGRGNLGEPPYIYAPYPSRIVQVREMNTPGEKYVSELLKKNWPSSINELEDIAKEENNQYSGGFIRSVLRNKYVPGEEKETNFQFESNQTVQGSHPESEEWNEVFRMGLRIGMERGASEAVVFDALRRGFVEGRMVREELGER